MSWLSSLKESLTGVAKSGGEFVSRIKEAIQGRAAEAPSAVEPPTTEFERYFEAWKQADYRSFAVPTTPEMMYERPTVLSRSQYAAGPESMRSQYMTAFEAAGYNPVTDELQSFTFGLNHDELLSEEEMVEAASDYAEEYGLETMEAVTAIGGISRGGYEEYMEL